MSQVATCIGCGCDDNHACDEGCWWIRLDRGAGLGVCNRCECDHAEAWDRGDRTQRATPIAELEAAASMPPPRIARPPQPKPADGCKGNHDWPFDDVRDSDRCRHCGMGFLRHAHTECP